ncbi:hypothetical protein GCM10014715_87190 [Streptomyces spiralis]|uniref:Uncharacterized protein n=1 Tax=Streptomyces spiralis TaxID=66376 RepID=A0A919APN8_9ACTN|nr:hypothetical protein GCM10014715_87190 [Streptomyces spiralis]
MSAGAWGPPRPCVLSAQGTTTLNSSPLLRSFRGIGWPHTGPHSTATGRSWDITEAHGVTPVQVVLCRHLQAGNIGPDPDTLN